MPLCPVKTFLREGAFTAIAPVDRFKSIKTSKLENIWRNFLWGKLLVLIWERPTPAWL
jgi:hypothetical protein